MIADASADADRCAADLLAQAEHGPDSDAILLSLDRGARGGGRRGDSRGPRTSSSSVVADLDEALARSEAYAPEHLELWRRADPRRSLARIANAGTIFVRTVGRRRRLRGGRDPRPPDGRPRAGRRRARARDLPQAGAGRPCERRGARARARDRAAARADWRGCAARRGAGARVSAGRSFRRATAPYAWSPSSADVAARHGLHAEQILRFDQNTPPRARRAAGPARRELRAPERVPGRHVRGAARTPPPPTAASRPSRSSSARARTS